MKDESKAQWPDKMTGFRVVENGTCAYRIMGERCREATVFAPTEAMLEHRTMQLLLLPEMVALLKFIDRKNYSDAHLRLQDIERMTESILKQIGEAE